MYKRILVPTDGSDLSFEAIQAATRLAKSIGAEIVAINIMPRPGQLAPCVNECDTTKKELAGSNNGNGLAWIAGSSRWAMLPS